MANSAPEPIDQVRSLMAAWAASQPVAIPHMMSTRVTACPAGVTYNGPRWPWLVGELTVPVDSPHSQGCNERSPS